ncbi:ClpP/crotonase-like domain-containing protein [Crepidotus variabilis]|uniref:ClpP/crotonase-like domain-containing protein n=1 Tax=Crepidotus variabilis TaxID=179855 RepID=A0A9P6EP78_9AGAR|nr:ClpP/crotonase-like domain-containing protein [Crepidotus variabilis]
MSKADLLPSNNPQIALKRPKPGLWIIELQNGVDNRLTDVLVTKGMMPALDIVEKEWRQRKQAAVKNKDRAGAGGALIIVGKMDQDKFFSNGLDFANSSKDPNFFQLTFDPMLKRLLVFPIPTIAAINGHCYAGGLMLSLACDYRVMTDGTSRNAWLCMNEVHFGAPWPHSFAAILRAKIGDHRLQRKIAIEGHKFTPQEALQDGILDYIVKGKTAEILAKAEELADKFGGTAAPGVWGLIKLNLYADVLQTMRTEYRLVTVDMDERAARSKL